MKNINLLSWIAQNIDGEFNTFDELRKTNGIYGIFDEINLKMIQNADAITLNKLCHLAIKTQRRLFNLKVLGLEQIGKNSWRKLDTK